MKYFNNIKSLGDLKKRYRKLLLENHPDVGGDTAVTQQIISEFESLYDIWKDRKGVVDNSGYEYDYAEATAHQYTEYVYNEYSWKGKRYDSKLRNKDLTKIFRKWVKEAYPGSKFSITKNPYNGIMIVMVEASFPVFVDKNIRHADFNYFSKKCDEKITERAQEVMSNIIDYVQSYNFSRDYGSDFKDVNFYPDFKIGSYDKNFKYVPLRLSSFGSVKRIKPTPTERKIKDAMKGVKWCTPKFYKEQIGDNRVLCKDDDSDNPYALYHSNDKMIPDKAKKLNDVGILCHIEKKRFIVFDGYSEEVKKAIEKEKAAAETKAEPVHYQSRPSENVSSLAVELIEYSERALVVKGDTKPVKDKLKELGGRFNPRLTCGPGWVFSKKKEKELKELVDSLSL